MEFEELNKVTDSGFVNFITVSALRMSYASIPRVRGVYLVVRHDTVPVKFLDKSPAGWFKAQDPSVPIEELQRKWIPRASTLYIGKAGGTSVKSSLYERLRTYMRFGLGSACAHRGGRYIWQLENACALRIYWSVLTEFKPAEVESLLLREFFKMHGRIPFANLRH